VSARIVSDLERFGALPSQLIDLAHETGPRVLRYLDLARAPVDGTAPVVFEVQGQPRAFVFDGRGRDPRSSVAHWIRRIAFRGDADWVGVLSPGRLDIYPAALDGQRDPRPLESFAQGPFLFPTLVHARSPGDVPSVRRALLDLLRNSIAEARRQHVDASDSLSLVGRALFWRFLLDRRLLEGISPTDISPKASSLESCLDNKARALRTFEWLEKTFNGSLLAFSSPHAANKIPESVYEGVVGNIAHGATIEGQLPLRLPLDWREVNFAHMPVGLLSEVYEAFAHEEHEEQARAESVHYTPRHIAEYVVDEALAALEQVEQPRVLDPASGAGVFLVAAFRALVAREWNRLGQKPPRKIVRRILNHQLVGFDINDNALRLSELAMYLTAIELDPEPQPRPLDLLRFNALRDEVLFLKEGGTEQGSLGPVERRFRSQFDVVLGNPPWTAVEAGSATKRVWVDNTRARVAELLGERRAAAFDFPDANPDLPFVWRATEWAKPKGVIALITHARWLFGQTKTALLARKDLFEGIHVTGILNGAALRNSSVWPNISHPFCLLFAINEQPPVGATFQFISPELERTPDKTQQHLRLDWNDAHDIAVSEVVRRPWTLKTRFRGTLFDDAIIDEVVRKGTAFGEYLDSIGTKLCNGYQVGGKKGTQHSARAMLGMPDLKGIAPGFIVETARLPKFTRPTLLFPRDRSIYKAPLLLIHESMKVDETAPRASLAFDDVAFDERFDGASFAGVLHGEQLASYLQLVIQSSFFTYALLFLDGQYGVEREVVHLTTLKRVPIIPWSELSAAHRKQSAILANRLRRGMSPDLLVEINEFVSNVFGFSNVHREAIEDSLRTALPTTSAKSTATRPTHRNERDVFAGVLESELSELLNTSVLVQELNDTNAPWRFLQVLVGRKVLAKPQIPQLNPDIFIEAADDASASMITVHVDGGTSFIGVLDQYRYWTRTRARLLASTLVSEKEAHG
jgi:N-6 DNA Methylase